MNRPFATPCYIDLLGHVPADLRPHVGCFSFNRRGGVSTRPFNELNLGSGTGDREENVRKNLSLIRDFTGLDRIFCLNQVHGTEIFQLKDRHVGSGKEVFVVGQGDGIITDAQGVGLMVRHADCQAVVLFDPVKRAIANIHCGWRGSVNAILPRAVDMFVDLYGSRPGDLWAGISPSLGPCCAQFRHWKEMLPEWMHSFRTGVDRFDFWAVSRMQLENAGIPEKQIFCAEICTACNNDFFSYRREHVTGRLGTVIGL